MGGTNSSKRDLTVVYEDRTFPLQAYREGQEWRGINENRTPISHWLVPTGDPVTGFAAAVGFVAATVDASGGPRAGKR